MESVCLRDASTTSCARLLATSSVVRRRNFHERRMIHLRRRQSQRRAVLILIVTSLLLEIVGSRMPRTIWMYERSAHWWNQIVLETFTDSDWLENFNVSRTTFVYLFRELEPVIAKKRTRFRRPISVQKRVAITLCVLATTIEYRTATHLFGVARCTVCCIVQETCKYIVRIFLPKYI